jgi:hypothetical protein
MTRIHLVVAIATTTLAASAIPARAAERMNDRMVKQVIENIDHGFDRWKGDLERRNMDDAVIRSAAGTVKVEDFLRDFERDIDTIKDRFNDNSSAGPEVTSLLRRASDVERRNRANGSAGQGAWSALSAELATLATAYGVSWPIDPSAQAQRLTDKELAAVAKDMGTAADHARGPMKDAAGQKVPKAAVTSAENDLKELKKAAETLEDGLKDGRATSAQATRVLELATKNRSFLAGLGPLNPTGTAAVATMSRSTEALARAFKIGVP